MSTKVNRLTAAAGSGPPFGPFSGRVGSTHPAQQRPAGRDLLFLGGLALCCNIIIFSFGRDRRRPCADKEISFGPAVGDLLFLLRFPLAPVPRPWLRVALGDLRSWVQCARGCYASGVHRCRAAGLVSFGLFVVLGDLPQIGGPGCAYPIKEKRNGPGFTCAPLPQLRPVVICRACARFALCVSVSLARVRNGGRLLLPDLPRFNLRFSEIVCTCVIFSPAAAVGR